MSNDDEVLLCCLPICRGPTRLATKETSALLIGNSGYKLKSAEPFLLKELKQATDNFNLCNILDRNCPHFTVYKGTLSSGEMVRVQRTQLGLDETGESPVDQLQKELELLSGLYHRNIVSLIGFCYDIEKNEHLLVYEHLPNGTLSDHLHDNPESPFSWERRLDIALCIAKGLAHLHEHTSPPIVHHNITSSSILLDSGFVAKLSEFGLWKQVHEKMCGGTRSTVGYLPPEYFETRKCTQKSDVFAFGVVMLELLTGERSFDVDCHPNDRLALLVHMVPSVLKNGGWEGVKAMLDPFIREDPRENQLQTFVNLALYCIEDEPQNRPDMKSVVDILDNLIHG